MVAEMTTNQDFLKESVQDPLATVFQELESREGELHLRFYVATEREFALPAMGIREVNSIPIDRITPIPNSSSLLLGTLNLRGRVIWVADLSQFLGEPTLNTERSEIPVITVEDRDMAVGLAVDKIVGMEWLDVEKVRMLENVPDNIAPFLRGEWLLDQQTNQRLQLLDPKAILRSRRWAG